VTANDCNVRHTGFCIVWCLIGRKPDFCVNGPGDTTRCAVTVDEIGDAIDRLGALRMALAKERDGA